MESATRRPSLKRKAKDDEAPEQDPSPPAGKRRRTRGNHYLESSQAKREMDSKSAKSGRLSKIESTAPDQESKDKYSEASSSSGLEVIEEAGSFFEAPEGAVLVHACNTIGSWGGGIAKAFHSLYPAAYEYYAEHCHKAAESGTNLVGTALLIPPMEKDDDVDEDDDDHEGSGESRHDSANLADSGNPQQAEQTSTNHTAKKEHKHHKHKHHYIGCLFTSSGFGRRRDPPKRILQATGPAMMDLLSQIDALERKTSNKPEDDSEEKKTKTREVRMCKINSGLFRVPWKDTKAELEDLDVSEWGCKTVKVVSPSEKT